MITLKSAAEIESLRRAGSLVAEAHRHVREQIRPGVTTRELDQRVETFLLDHNGASAFRQREGRVSFPAATCMSVNSVLTCGIPDDRPLEEGDLLTIDIGCCLDGWYADCAQTCGVGHLSDDSQRLLDAGRQLLETAIDESRPNRPWSEVANRMASTLAEDGSEWSIVPELHGHGVGRTLHEDPQVIHVPELITAANDFRLEPGLVFTIEPVLVHRGSRLRKSANGWTMTTDNGLPGVHFEHTLAMTTAGPVNLTGQAYSG